MQRRPSADSVAAAQSIFGYSGHYNDLGRARSMVRVRQLSVKFLLLSTRRPAKVEYSGAQAGHTAHYLLRWLTRRGEPGPWSETASATVGA